jgi:hypothetical protein
MSLTEVMKSAADDIKAILMPHYLSLTNIPNKEEIVAAVRDITTKAQLTREQAEQMVEEAKKQAYEEARVKLMIEQKERELDLKEQKQTVEIEKIQQETKRILEETVAKAIESIYSATQGGAQIVSMPAVAPAADQVLKSAGFVDKDMAPIVATPGPIVAPDIPKNTSPMFPGRIQEPDVQIPGEEMPDMIPQANAGINRGIEAQGVQWWK